MNPTEPIPEPIPEPIAEPIPEAAQEPLAASPIEEQPDLLEELTAFTGLFNPERIWQMEEQFDDLDEANGEESRSGEVLGEQ